VRSEYPLAYTPVVSKLDPEYAELDLLFRTLNAKPFDTGKADGLIDMDQWTRWFAVSEILENSDSPWYKGARNYSLLKPPSGKWLILPWDLDQVYRGKGIYLPETRVRGLRSLLSSPEFRRLKNNYLRKFLKENFGGKTISAWIDEMSPAVEKAIRSGEEKSVDLDVWKKEVKELKEIIIKRHAMLLRLVEDDKSNLPSDHKKTIMPHKRKKK
jgi:spore coat protein CotH